MHFIMYVTRNIGPRQSHLNVWFFSYLKTSGKLDFWVGSTPFALAKPFARPHQRSHFSNVISGLAFNPRLELTGSCSNDEGRRS